MRNIRIALIASIAAMLVSTVMVFGQQKAPAAAPAAAPAKAAKAAADADLLDVNTCSKAELVKLGLSDDVAQKIVAGRPYKMKTQLKSRDLVPDALYAKIADKIIAKQPAKKK